MNMALEDSQVSRGSHFHQTLIPFCVPNSINGIL